MFPSTIDFEKEYIHGDKFRPLADVCISQDSPLDYLALDKISNKNAVIFCDACRAIQLLSEMCTYKGKYILITHNNDLNITPSVLDMKPACIVKWYGMNMCVNAECVQGIPIGLARPRWEPEFDHRIIASFMKRTKRIKSLALLNHTTHTNSEERHKAEEPFSGKPWCTYIPLYLGQPRLPMAGYVRLVNESKFMVSPPGNGFDCHRTWEAIYLSTIPIVKKCIASDWFSELPMLLVSDWMICSKAILENDYSEFEKKSFSYQMSTISYWLGRIEEDKKRLL